MSIKPDDEIPKSFVGVSDSPKKIKNGNRRVTGKEQFYTPRSTAQIIVDVCQEIIPDFENRVVIEPAGGTGIFVDLVAGCGVNKIISYDIEPHHPLVTKGNFLEQDLDLVNAVTISNPPFGRNHSLSVPFFQHAAKFSEYIVFIVPRSWRKWTILNKLNRNFHLIRDDDLNINFVDADGERAFEKNNLRTCVQYWQRKSEERVIVRVRDMGFIRRCKFDEADVSLTIFGYGCGAVKTEFPKKKNTTQMFLKLLHPRSLEALQKVDFSIFYSRTAYTEALSIMEINFLLNEYITGDPMIESQTDLLL